MLLQPLPPQVEFHICFELLMCGQVRPALTNPQETGCISSLRGRWATRATWAPASRALASLCVIRCSTAKSVHFGLHWASHVLVPILDTCRAPPVLPFYHSGMGRVLPKHKWVPRVGQSVTVAIGQPVNLDTELAKCNCKEYDQELVGAAFYQTGA